MILLNGHSLTPVKRLRPETQPLTLKERDGTSSLTLADTDGITMTSWMQDETDPGAGIVWRVRSIQDEFGTGTATVQLEHIINTLRDKILFGEIKADTITGVEGATTCTALQAVNYILAQQSDWVLYNFDYGSVVNAYKFDGDNLFDALERVTETLEDPWWSYDTTVYPFRLSITHKQSGTACEMRPGRNLVSVNRTIDKNGMYTRFYPIGKEDLHIPGNYVQRNTGVYGVVDHVDTDTTRETVAELTAWSNERLARHAEPRVTSSADGLELADATGEPLDRLTLGRICRMPLPEYGTTIEERITELNYRDKIHQPTVVRVTMGNQQDDIMKLIADEMKNGAGPIGSGRGGGGGRGGARQQKEDHAWFEDTDEHVAMVAEGLIGVDAQGNPNWTRLAQIIVDGTGIHAGVKDFINELEHFQTDFTMNETAISMVVGRYNNQNYIKAGEIALAINQSTGASEAKIDADHVYIGNEKSTTVIAGKAELSDVTASYISSKISEINLISAHAITCDGLLTAGGGLYVLGVNCSSLPSGVKSVRISGPSSNTYKLQYTTYDDSSWTDAGSFSRAVSSWSVGGGSGNVNVTANPQGQMKSVPISVSGPNSITSNGTYTYKAMFEDSSGSDVETGASRSVTVNVSTSDRYNEGWNACRAEMLSSGYTWSGYTGTPTKKYDAPTYGAAERDVLYPYSPVSFTRYSVPAAK